MKLASILLALMAYAAPALAQEEGDWRLVYDRSVEVPDGDSYSSDFLLQITDAKLIKVEMRDDRGARCDTRTTAVDVSHVAAQRIYKRYTPNAEGIYELDQPTVVYIKFWNFQDTWRTAYCRRLVWAKAAGGSDGDGYAIAGVVRYDGGFAQNLNVPVASRDKVVKVKVEVPSFCGDTQVLEVGTVTEGVYDAAADMGDGIFAVNGDAGSRISAIQVTLNGPRTAACDIPVWIATAVD